MSNVVLSNIGKSYGTVEVLHAIDLDIEAGEFVVFVGPSGCGKSTLLRMIAGLEDVTVGTLSIGGRVVNELEPAERGVAMVFQSYALYPHMSVAENMRFGLEMTRVDKKAAERRIRHTAQMLQIEHLLDRKPAMLSGGQRQRVAIGRAIVREPSIFLFDEPLSNLDAALRVQTRIELAKLHHTLRATMIYVTHDQVEAMTLADKIVVLNAGRIAQCGTPLDLYDRPADTFVASFVGASRINLLDVGNSGTAQSTPRYSFDGRVKTIGVRPEHVIVGEAGTDSMPLLTGNVCVIERLGDHTLVHVESEAGVAICAKLPGNAGCRIGDRMALFTSLETVHLFDASDKRIEATS